MAGLPLAQGYPDYVTQANGQLIPTLFSTLVNVKFYRESCIPGITNANWQDEIKKMGQEVVIRNKPDVAVFNISKGMDFSDQYQTLTAPSISLIVDHGVGYAFEIDAILKQQADISWAPHYLDDAGHKIKENVEDAVLADIITQADATMSGLTAGPRTASINLGTAAAPIALDRTNILQIFSRMNTCLAEANTPTEGRWASIPPVLQHLISTSDLNAAFFSGDGESLALKKNGFVRNLYDINIFKTNSTAIQSGTTFYIPFGHDAAVTFAGQMTVARELPPQKGVFGDFYDGMFVYGWKVVKPTVLGVMVCTVTS